MLYIFVTENIQIFTGVWCSTINRIMPVAEWLFGLLKGLFDKIVPSPENIPSHKDRSERPEKCERETTLHTSIQEKQDQIWAYFVFAASLCFFFLVILIVSCVIIFILLLVVCFKLGILAIVLVKILQFLVAT